ncbi:MAG: hypothetical protein AAB479_01080 [Patescibacteria group bacterium]
MKSKYLIIIGISVAAIIASILLYPQQQANGELDAFAQCLAEKGITMYGADWCPHCQNEKKAFGDSFRLVPYVECPDDPQKCLAAGINGYPTWVFPASSARLDPASLASRRAERAGGLDGKKLEGEQGLEKLSQESGCILPDNKK